MIIGSFIRFTPNDDYGGGGPTGKVDGAAELSALGIDSGSVIEGDQGRGSRQVDGQGLQGVCLGGLRDDGGLVGAANGRGARNYPRRGVDAQAGRHSVGVAEGIGVVGGDGVGERLVEVRVHSQGTGDFNLRQVFA